MSQRKLQQDIERLLKKVKEGLQDFEEVYDKFQSTDASNISYREKLESDLKREIKKLASEAQRPDKNMAQQRRCERQTTSANGEPQTDRVWNGAV